VKQIQLTQGKVAIVDDEDYELLSTAKWQYGNGYAKCRTAMMHRVVADRMGLPESKQVNAVDGNFLNCRRNNLKSSDRYRKGCDPFQKKVRDLAPRLNGFKPTTEFQLQLQLKADYQVKYTKKPVSKFKGVYWRRPGVWQASITANYKTIYLGEFGEEEDAAKAYNEAAKKYHGKNRKLNQV
jgi:hypothetical protein